VLIDTYISKLPFYINLYVFYFICNSQLYIWKMVTKRELAYRIIDFQGWKQDIQSSLVNQPFDVFVFRLTCICNW